MFISKGDKLYLCESIKNLQESLFKMQNEQKEDKKLIETVKKAIESNHYDFNKYDELYSSLLQAIKGHQTRMNDIDKRHKKLKDYVEEMAMKTSEHQIRLNHVEEKLEIHNKYVFDNLDIKRIEKDILGMMRRLENLEQVEERRNIILRLNSKIPFKETLKNDYPDLNIKTIYSRHKLRKNQFENDWEIKNNILYVSKKYLDYLLDKGNLNDSKFSNN